jgi:GNAT superfamily N-acetyltransferase
MDEQNDLIFQRAERNDSPEILELLQRISAWLEGKGVEQWREFFEEKGKATLEKRFREGEVYKILKDGSLSGVFVIQWDDTFWHPMKNDGLATWIHTMGIDSSLVGKGIGNKILSYVEAIAVRAGRKYVRLDCNGDNAKLCAYYESNGFKKAGTKSWERWMVSLYEKEIG